MPRNKFTKKVIFTPNLANTESKEESSDSEPEQYKYGIYHNDGYDYMKHMVSMEDFLNPLKDLNSKIEVAKKPNPINLLSQSKKPVTVIKEFEVLDEGFQDKAIEKLKEMANGEIDEDILHALDSDAELSDLENDFVQIANGDVAPNNIKGDAQLFNRFLGNCDEEEDFTDNYDSNTKDIFNFSNNISRPINEIADSINFDNNFEQMKHFEMPYLDSSNSNTLSLAFLNAFESEQNKDKKSYFETASKEVLEFNKLLYKGETEYNEAEIDKAVEEWTKRKPEIKRKSLKIGGKKSKIAPIVVSVPKRMKIESSEKMEYHSEPVTEHDEEEQVEFTDVSQFHVPRPQDETCEEKRERKRAIKAAKRTRTQEKKVTKQTFKIAKKMF